MRSFSVEDYISRFKNTLYIWLNFLCMFVCYSSVLLFTASLPGKETFMFHYLIDSTSITLLSFHVGFSSVRTTAPMKLSSSRCELSPLTHTCMGCGREPSQTHGQAQVILGDYLWSLSVTDDA